MYVAKVGNMYFKDWVRLRDYYDFVVTNKIQRAAIWYEKGKTPTTKYLISIGFKFCEVNEDEINGVS